MGMTIDLAIEELESTKDYPASDPASDEALDFAIDTMRKYQKIEQIIEGYFAPFSQDIASQCMREIKEVIEDESESYD